MAYSPAFQFYPKDFLADPNTIRMEPLHIGAYLLLLMECWDRDNRLPKDIEILAEVCRMTVEEFKPIWEKRLARCFKEKKTFYWHKRLGEEIEKQKEWKSQHSESGKKGAEKRWATAREKNSFSEKISENSKEKSTDVKSTKDSDLQNGTAMASPSVAIAANSSSSSSSSSTKKNKNKEKRLPPRAAAPKGKRLPDPFFLTAEMKHWGKQKRPKIDLEYETEKFCNYWRAKAGRDAAKLDWLATWKNWILNAKENHATGNGKPSTLDKLSEYGEVFSKYESEKADDNNR